jgi:hypothetical protein
LLVKRVKMLYISTHPLRLLGFCRIYIRVLCEFVCLFFLSFYAIFPSKLSNELAIVIWNNYLVFLFSGMSIKTDRKIQSIWYIYRCNCMWSHGSVSYLLKANPRYDYICGVRKEIFLIHCYPWLSNLKCQN